jgi:hypothetical protein
MTLEMPNLVVIAQVANAKHQFLLLFCYSSDDVNYRKMIEHAMLTVITVLLS